MSSRQRATACSVCVCVRGKSHSPACGRGWRQEGGCGTQRGGKENSKSTGASRVNAIRCRTPSKRGRLTAPMGGVRLPFPLVCPSLRCAPPPEEDTHRGRWGLGASRGRWGLLGSSRRWTCITEHLHGRRVDAVSGNKRGAECLKKQGGRRWGARRAGGCDCDKRVIAEAEQNHWGGRRGRGGWAGGCGPLIPEPCPYLQRGQSLSHILTPPTCSGAAERAAREVTNVGMAAGLAAETWA